jgi:hypothetical protein
MAYGHSQSRRRFRRAGIPLRIAFAVLILVAGHAVLKAANSTSLRAFWIAPSSLSSPLNIRRAISSAVSSGYDAVIAPLAIGAASDPNSFDAGAEVLQAARENRVAAHLSVSVNIAAATGELPASRDHVIYQHPEWLMVPRQIAPEMLKIDPRSPAYLGQIARWTRANADRVDGLYVSPLDPAAASYLANAVIAAVGKYTSDGVYLDAVEFPGEDFDYSRHAMDLFRARLRSVMSVAERARLDDIEAIDPFAYPEEFPDEWRRFRESALTDLLERIRTGLSGRTPTVSLAAGARADADASLREHFQAWRTWLDRGIVDRVGYRSRSTGTVLLSAEGVVTSLPPSPSSAVQAAGVAGSR